jgi:hypothetical protein
MKANTSSTSRTEKQLMFTEVKMKKEEMSLFGTSTVEPTRDGRSSTPTRLKQQNKRE